MATSMRQAIARLMTFSKAHIPHYYLTMRAEMSAALDRREEYNMGQAVGEALSVNDLVLKAVALALERHQEFNGYFRNGEFEPRERINIGIAIALDDGLVAPAVLDCRGMPISVLAKRTRDLAARARQGTLRAEEYNDATFTLTNLGMFQVDSFAAIIVPPQVGILAVGNVSDVLVMHDGELITEHRAALTLSGDHRATDGAEGARFMGAVVQALHDPDALFAA